MSRSSALKINSVLSFERLESRQLLAADMAEIFGAVMVDIQGDANPTNDTVVAGATANLYLDNGNGVLDSGDALLGSDVTDTQGQYSFSGLGAGKYFVKVTLPASMRFAAGQDVQEVNVTADEADGVTGPTIDKFTSFQLVQATPPLPSSDPDSLVDSNVLGGERDMFVQLNSAENPVSSVSLVSTNGKLYFASGSGVTGTAKIVWDGADNNGQTVNPTGLGGYDLTQSGGNKMTGIALTSGADHPNAVIKLRIYTDANNWSEFTTTVPETLGGTASGTAVFNFTDLPTASSGNGADFANVGAIELTFEGVSAVDAQVTEIELVGIATKEANFTAVPTLSLGDQVWADKDDDGIFDADEVGIANVAVNLYQDTNGDNSYTQGVDAFLGSTSTDASGKYSFGNLVPGDYIVQIDPVNFQVNGPLAGLVSSGQGATAPDPDNDVNNDDNGTPLAGAGVVSSAVTISGQAEPINDGDLSSSSNLTVDFGFFGFDLVLDKAVQQTTVSPTETLEYNIKIDNDGPSAAENTTFEDVLPSHVTYVSGTVSTGAALSHTAGVVTANLGTMQPGDTIYITILVTVDDDARETLVNTATVVAPKEVDLSNNTDTVTNPVEPKIDLAIVKSDSEDPVAAGSSFQYILEYTNNGPSDATGVVITDDLPDEGVSFVNASLTPSSNNGDLLTFNIGDLDAGESGTIVITVRVDDDFSGELLNHTEIVGNETEITLANNQDTEPTLVQIEPGSIGGTVYVDQNKNGTFNTGERTISGVEVTLIGLDMFGNSVRETTTTDSNGQYLFDELTPGTYRIEEQQPARYRDGEETVGSLGGATGEEPGLLIIPNDVDAGQLDDLLFGIQLESGENGTDYNFGEQAVSVSKLNFMRSLNW